jgi:hypothetical protein
MTSHSDRQLLQHALETGAAAGIAVLVAAIFTQRVPWPAILAAGLAVTVGAAVTGVVATDSGGFGIYLSGWGLAVTGWSMYARVAGLWTATAIVSLLVIVAVLSPLGAVILARSRLPQPEQPPEPEEDDEAAERRGWQQILADLGCPGVQCLAVHKVTDGGEQTGKMVYLRLPKTGKVKMSHVQELTEQLEIKLRYRRGAIRVAEGKYTCDITLYVTEKDVLDREVPFTWEDKAASINRPLLVGRYENGAAAVEKLREIAVGVFGPRGKGKTNLLNVLIGRLGFCEDAVIFMIDLKGGRAAIPWIEPWVRGLCSRPVIDWVATTPPEAELMLRACLDGIKARSSGVRGEKVIPSRKRPAVIMICDEIAIIFRQDGRRGANDGAASNRVLASLGFDITQLGRSEAIDPVYATQRGTVTMIGGGDMKSQLGLRFGLGTYSQQDARSIVPDDHRAARRLAQLGEVLGAGTIVRNNVVSAPLKYCRVSHDVPPGHEEDEHFCGPGCQPWQVAIAASKYRPPLDQLTADAMGDAYRLRWERAGEFLAHIGGETDVDAELDSILAAETGQRSRGQARMLEMLRERGIAGASPLVLLKALEAEGITVARETLSRWLAAERDAGMVVNEIKGLWKHVEFSRGGNREQPPADTADGN